MKPFWFGEGEVSNAGVFVRLGAIGAVMLSVAGAFAYTGGWLSPVRLTQDRMMAAFQDANGTHAGSVVTTQREFASPAGSKAAGRQRNCRKPLSSGPDASRWSDASRSLAACPFRRMRLRRCGGRRCGSRHLLGRNRSQAWTTYPVYR